MNYINKLIKSSYKISYENKAKVKWQIDSSNYKIFKRYKEYSYGALNTEYKYVWYKGFIRNIIFAFIIIYLSISYSYYFLLILLILIFLRSYQYLRYLKIFKIQNIIKILKLLIINVLQLLIIDYASFISLFKKIKLSIFANFKKISLFII